MQRTYLSNLMSFAQELAYDAGRVTLGYFQRPLDVEYKADNSPVTLADTEAERLIRSRIQARYPDHAIVGEEYGQEGANTSEHCWIIDPIDGTKSFMRGVPLYANLIALEIAGRIEVGVANFPALNEMVCGASGVGAFLNGRVVRAAQTKTLEQAIVSFTDLRNFERYAKQAALSRVLKQAYYCVGWSDAYGHALVATGRCDVMLDPIMNPWDCAPFPVILREAKGFSGSWSGEERIDKSELLSTSLQLKEAVVALLTQVD